MSLIDKLLEVGAVYDESHEEPGQNRYILFDGQEPVVEVIVGQSVTQASIHYGGGYTRVDVEGLKLAPDFDFGSQVAGLALEVLHLRPELLKHVTGPWVEGVIGYHNSQSI